MSNRILTNLNRRVMVKITEAGENAWREHYKFLGLPLCPIRRDSEGYTELVLWEVCNIFGRHMYNGVGQTPIETEFYIIGSAVDDQGKEVRGVVEVTDEAFLNLGTDTRKKAGAT